MDTKAIVIWCVIGLLAGWLASFVVGGGGLIRYLLTGLIGAFVGGFLFRLIGFAAVGLIGHLVTAVVGAVVLLYVVQILKRA